MIIKVPKNKSQTEEPRDTINYIYREIEPKETVYSICKAAEITEEEFYDLNPQVKENGLQIGQEIKLPKGKKVVEQVASDTTKPVVESNKPKTKPYDLYRVKPGDNVAIIARKFNCTPEDILQLNPELVNGVVPGRYIVVPVAEKTTPKTQVSSDLVSMFWRIPSVYEKPEINLAVVAPLYLNENDSLEYNAFEEKDVPVFKNSEFGLQFLAGVQLALDTLVGLGYRVNLEVYDSRNDLEEVAGIARKISPNTQLIIGPLYSMNAENLARLLPDRTIVSPMSKSLNNTGRTNLVDCINYIPAEIGGVIESINGYVDSSHIVFVNLDTIQNHETVSRISQEMVAVDSNQVNYLWVDKQFKELSNLNSYLDQDKQNVLVVIDQNPAFLSHLMRMISKRKDSAILVLGTSRIFEIPTLENRYLNNVRFVGMNTEYRDLADTTTQLFINKFRILTATEPNKFAYAGFDTGLYFAQLLAAYGSIPEVSDWPAWRGINKGFRFKKEGENGAKNCFYLKIGLKNYQLIPVE